MARFIAEVAGRHDIVLGVPSAVAKSDKVFGRCLKSFCILARNAMVRCKCA